LNEATEPTQRVPEPSLIQYTHWIYGLHALSVLIGVLSHSSIAGRFVFGLPSIVAVIMNYARRSDAHSTFLEAHFHWQIRTFWFALLWLLATAVISWPLMLVGIGIPMWWIARGITGIWVVYRIVRGWLALRDGKPIVTTPSSGVAAT
jgi:uncharacterized membrane protein